MRISIHSIKGGVGKTTIALMLGRAAASTYGKKTVVIDCDFLGAGMQYHLPWVTVPEQQLDDYFLKAAPHDYDLNRILGSYSDERMRESTLHVIPNSGGVHPQAKHIASMIADECHYQEINTRLRILVERLEKELGFECIIIDNSTGTHLLFDSIRSLVGTYVLVTTPIESDCVTLLKLLEAQDLFTSHCFLFLNKARYPVLTYDAFIETVVSKVCARNYPFQWKQFQLVPESENYRRFFLSGEENDLAFDQFGMHCSKILFARKGGQENA